MKTDDSAGNPPQPGIEGACAELASKIAQKSVGAEVVDTPVVGLTLYRREQPSDPVSGLYEPSVCLVVQGAKRVELGSETIVYDPHRYLITSVRLPTRVQVIEASPQRPYLGLRLLLDQQELSRLMVDSQLPPPKEQKSTRAMAVGDATTALMSAFSRLIDLMDAPQDIPILAPTIQREIIYRLLVGDQGGRLRQIASTGSQSNQIARVLDWLQDHFMQPLRIEDLAGRAGMSASTFHQHFRAMTAMSPLQYQKQLRLREAQRLMLTGQHDAASASFEVGYESPSQFSREYSRLFGAPPLRDINRLKQQMALEAG
ncbi:AraC family transcriptional regulator [Magnetofaba australis]|nr:AraC family transcriptional regulator [Magnetofaba australis]